jgi:glutaredoxin
MKKLKGLLLVLAVICFLPFTVHASEKINVYIFRGEGCPHCEEALEFFDSLSDEYKSYFDLIEKEVWYDEDNAADMQSVADYFGETVSGVPYIVIGDQTFSGYSSTYDTSIKSAIKTAYENEDGSYVDVVAAVLGDAAYTSSSSSSTTSSDDDSNSAAITVIVLLVAVAGVAFLIYMARDDDASVSVEKKEVEAEKKAPTTKKVSATKKTSTTKKASTAKKASTGKSTKTTKKTTKK